MPAAIYLGKGNRNDGGQNRGCSGSIELSIAVSRRSWREISFCGKLVIDTKKEKRSKKKETPLWGLRKLTPLLEIRKER